MGSVEERGREDKKGWRGRDGGGEVGWAGGRESVEGGRGLGVAMVRVSLEHESHPLG